MTAPPSSHARIKLAAIKPHVTHELLFGTSSAIRSSSANAAWTARAHSGQSKEAGRRHGEHGKGPTDDGERAQHVRSRKEEDCAGQSHRRSFGDREGEYAAVARVGDGEAELLQRLGLGLGPRVEVRGGASVRANIVRAGALGLAHSPTPGEGGSACSVSSAPSSAPRSAGAAWLAMKATSAGMQMQPTEVSSVDAMILRGECAKAVQSRPRAYTMAPYSIERLRPRRGTRAGGAIAIITPTSTCARDAGGRKCVRGRTCARAVRGGGGRGAVRRMARPPPRLAPGSGQGSPRLGPRLGCGFDGRPWRAPAVAPTPAAPSRRGG
jgi:hypothetical protein